jgi:biopolymer transport protein ExbB
MFTYLLDAFGGPAGVFMYALLAVAAMELAVLAERSVSLWRFRVDGDALQKRIESGDTRLGDRPMERVLRAGLAAPAELAWDAMQGAAVEAELDIRRRIPYLSTIASVATMIGLFGTVYGLILAFAAVGDVAAAERAARMSEGSSTAMATTAFGLLVAIPALAGHALLDGQARELLARIEVAATRLHVWRRSG